MSASAMALPSKFLNMILFIYRLYIFTKLQLKEKVFNFLMYRTYRKLYIRLQQMDINI